MEETNIQPTQVSINEPAPAGDVVETNTENPVVAQSDNNDATTGPTMAPQPAPQSEPMWKQWLQGPKLKYAIIGVISLIVIGIVGYAGPGLFKASLTESKVAPSGSAALYIPDYTANPTDTGNIAIKLRKNGITAPVGLHSIKFKLKYSPVTALTFDTNSIVFDSDATTGTVFQSADLKSINTSTAGEVLVSLFSTKSVALSTTDTRPLIKLSAKVNGTAGSSITMTVSDVEVIEASTGSIPYKTSTTLASIDAGKITLTTKSNLRALNAEALDSEHVLIRFSDLLSNVGNPADYVLTYSSSNTPVTVISAVTGYGHLTFTGYDQKTVILKITKPTVSAAGQSHVITLKNQNIQGNTTGALDTNYNIVKFDGYTNPDGINVSDVKLKTVTVKSATDLVLNFSGALTSSTVTPINIEIYDSSSAKVTLVKTELDTAGTTINITTPQLVADKNYFIRFNGVTDSSGLKLVNNTLANFVGYKSATISVTKVSPSTVINSADSTVVAIGTNLDTVSKVLVGTVEAKITQQTSGALSFTVVKAFTAGVYDIKFINKSSETTTLTKALVVSDVKKQMKIVSASSKALPYKVAPDGKTKVTFWVLVEDEIGLNNIDSAIMNLEQIGGNKSQQLTKATGIQPKNQQYYTYTTTVDTKTSTSTTAYALPVEIKKGSEAVKGTVSLMVTNDIYKSVAPKIDQAYVSPTTISPDGKTTAVISAQITDTDGISTIKSVTANLGALGAGFVTLKASSSSSATTSTATTSTATTTTTAATTTTTSSPTEQTTGFYVSDKFTVPTTATQQKYSVVITAADSTGESATKTIDLTVSSAQTGPKIDTVNTYLSPAKQIARDGKSSFTVNAMVSDPDGVSDITSVIAYSSTMGITPTALTASTTTSKTAKNALYSSKAITPPITAVYGVHKIQVIATDSNGTTASTILQLNLADTKIVGDAPIVFSTRSYTSPKVAVNDGKTATTLYAFVRDDDNDLESVVVNLSKIGQVGTATASDFKQTSSSTTSASSIGISTSSSSNSASTTTSSSSSSSSCNTNSKTIVCMQPSYKEGTDGQWFVLSGVTIASTTLGSSKAYDVDVIATDKSGKTGRGTISIIIKDSTGYTADSTPPKILAAVPVSSSQIEVLFNEAILSSTISSSGKEFTISDKNDVSKTLSVISAAINSSNNIITLTTASQTSGSDYVVNGSSKITDTSGISLSSGTTKASLKGYKANTWPPVVHYVSATSSNTVEIEFQNDLRPSSVKLGASSSSSGGDYDFEIFPENSSTKLPIYSVQFGTSGKEIILKTATQESGKRYSVQIKNIASADGVALKAAVAKFFKAVNVSAVKQTTTATQGDMNGDGKVDFIDFTMFSAVYGKTYGTGSSSSTSAPATSSSTSSTTSSSSLTPITKVPDSTVPTTSVPAGGAIVKTTSSPKIPTASSATTSSSSSSTTTSSSSSSSK